MKIDYNKMKCMLAIIVADKLCPIDIEDILMNGHIGYERHSNNELLEVFLANYDKKDIPMIEEVSKWKNI